MQRLNNIEKKIIQAVFNKGELSKRDLCKTTSSSWAGVSKYVKGLLEKGFVKEIPAVKSSGVGRPAVRIEINPNLLFAGVGISYSKVQVVITDPKGVVIHLKEKILSRDDDPIPEAVKIINHLITRYKKDRVISLGISFPGIIEPKKSVVCSSVYFSEFFNRNLSEEFETAINMDIPIIVERNAVCELYGITKGRQLNDDSLLISLNSGVTGALQLDGKIFDGNSGKLSKLGHFPDLESLIPCLCGKTGCIDTTLGEVAWIRDYRKILKLPGSGDSFYDAIENGMPQAVQILKNSLKSLTVILEPLLMLFGPENLIFCADLPPSSGLIFSTFMNQNIKFTVQNVIIADNVSAPKGAAYLGFLNICNHSN